MSDFQPTVFPGLNEFIHVFATLQAHEEKQHVSIDIVELVMIKTLSIRRFDQINEAEEGIVQIIATLSVHWHVNSWPTIERRVLRLMTFVAKGYAVARLEPAMWIQRPTKNMVSLNTIRRKANYTLVTIPSLDEATPQPETPAIRPASLHSQYQPHLLIDELQPIRVHRASSSVDAEHFAIARMPQPQTMTSSTIGTGVMDAPSPTSQANPAWIRDVLILALDLYLKHRDSLPSKHHPEVKTLSQLLGRIGETLGLSKSGSFRNENGVYMKLGNFRRWDPEYPRDGKSGLAKVNKDERLVWDEFASAQ